MMIEVLWAISWLIDAVLLRFSLRAMSKLGRASSGPRRRMLRMSLALSAILIASATLVIASRACWARLTALVLAGGPALLVVVVLLYLCLVGLLVRDWK